MAESEQSTLNSQAQQLAEAQARMNSRMEAYGAQRQQLPGVYGQRAEEQIEDSPDGAYDAPQTLYRAQQQQLSGVYGEQPSGYQNPVSAPNYNSAEGLAYTPTMQSGVSDEVRVWGVAVFILRLQMISVAFVCPALTCAYFPARSRVHAYLSLVPVFLVSASVRACALVNMFISVCVLVESDLVLSSISYVRWQTPPFESS